VFPYSYLLLDLDKGMSDFLPCKAKLKEELSLDFHVNVPMHKGYCLPMIHREATFSRS